MKASNVLFVSCMYRNYLISYSSDLPSNCELVPYYYGTQSDPINSLFFLQVKNIDERRTILKALERDRPKGQKKNKKKTNKQKKNSYL